MPALMNKPTDIRVVGTRLYFMAVRTRVPLKFGIEVTTSVTVARAGVRVADRRGRVAEGWGETPLSVQWVWPGALPYEARHATLKDFSVLLAKAWAGFSGRGRPSRSSRIQSYILKVKRYGVALISSTRLPAPEQ